MRRLMMQKNGGEPSISFPTIYKVENLVISADKKSFTLDKPINPTNKFIIKGNFTLNRELDNQRIIVLDVSRFIATFPIYIYYPLFIIELTTDFKIKIIFYKNSSSYVSIVSQDDYVPNTEYEFEFYFDNENIKEEIRLWENVGGELKKIKDVEYNETITVDDYNYITFGNTADHSTSGRKLYATFKYIEIQQES